LSAQALGELPESDIGLGKRLFHALRVSTDWPDFLDLARSRRDPVSRIRRILLSALFGLSSASAQESPPIRLLGMNAHGKQLLSQVKCKIISRPAGARIELAQESSIGDIQTLFYPMPANPGQEWRTGVICEECRV
jgi:predicted nucleotidyltransferase